MRKASKKTPRVGHPVRGSRSGRPIMVLLDLLGRRWALRVLWELRTGPATFRALRERCGDLSPTVLNGRLKELRVSGVVELVPDDGYRLTRAGDALLEALQPLQDWARTWLDS